MQLANRLEEVIRRLLGFRREELEAESGLVLVQNVRNVHDAHRPFLSGGECPDSIPLAIESSVLPAPSQAKGGCRT